eukprot:Plantae.Rhodophyta-Purpureofilum_apyrenoidigerum.ctg3273.p1 GENE.Plantae.Rhodophyta-Purpureofilum_apyrenoidigerum.ctg3273~~Plantae.Rhodophyta-Purpureofilum_apyrenoidigerum.ctg3273.p1  ORF type:complete len:996 (-),score=178.83 Plantae.Rhodophyta-Purpureofilum_apyrenoidigerum.ctg3273:133-3120(-)
MVNVEELRLAVKQFHAEGVDPRRRNELQQVLLQVLERSESLQLAVSVLRPQNEDQDPQLAFFCAVVLDNICRKRFESVPASDRYGIATSLFAVLTKHCYPDFVNAKLADVIVQYGKREIAFQTGMHVNFLDSAVATAGTADSGSSFSALEVLASAVQNFADSRRSDLPSTGKVTYCQQLRSKSRAILAALSKGLLVNDDRLASICVEAIQSMFVNIAQDMSVLDIFQETIIRRYGDKCAWTAATALAEIYNTRRLCDDALAKALEHATILLTNQSAKRHIQFLIAALNMIEGLLEKNVISAAVNAELSTRLDSHLLSLLSLTVSCESPEVFLAALKCWHVTAERLADVAAEADSKRAESARNAASQLKDGLMNLAQQCLKRALYTHNGSILESLEYWSDDEDENLWADDHESLWTDDQTLAIVNDMNIHTNGTDSLPERTKYITKCLQVINELDRLFPAELRSAAITFGIETISKDSCNIEDKLVALQLLADCASSEPNHGAVVVLIERIAMHCLTSDSMKLRRAAYRAIGSLASSLQHNVVMAQKIAEVAARDALLHGADAKNLSIAASVFLCNLTSKVRAPIFDGEPIDGDAVRGAFTARGASFLVLSAFHVRLLPPKGTSTADGSISEAEWHERSTSFKAFLRKALRDFETVCESDASQFDEETLCRIVDRGSLALHSIFVTARGELSGTRDGAWVSCNSYILASVNAVLKIGFRGNGKPVIMLLRMLSTAFATCRRFVEGLPQNVIQCTLQLASTSPAGSARDKVLNALFVLLKSELSEAVPGSADEMIASAVDLCSKYILKGGDPETKVLALKTLDEAICRHWRFFFPSDTSEAFLNGGRSHVVDDGSQFNIAMQGILGALSSQEPEVFSTGLSCLETANKSRMLFSRQAFINGQVGINTLEEVFRALVSRTRLAYQDRLVVLLYNICTPNASMFLELFLPRLIQSQGHLTEWQQHDLLSKFGKPTDISSFQQAVEMLINDIAYLVQAQN